MGSLYDTVTKQQNANTGVSAGGSLYDAVVNKNKPIPMKEPGPGTPSFTFNAAPLDINKVQVPTQTQAANTTPSIPTKETRSLPTIVGEAGASFVAKSAPAQAIANVQAGMPLIKAIVKAYNPLPTPEEQRLKYIDSLIAKGKATQEQKNEFNKAISSRSLEQVLASIGMETPTKPVGLIDGIAKEVPQVERQIATEAPTIGNIVRKEVPSVPTVDNLGNPINLKEIPPQTKMGDLAQYASNQGFKQYDNAFNGGLDIRSIASTEKPLQAPVANEIPKVDVVPIQEKIPPVTGKVSGVAKQIEQGAIERGLIDKGYENLPEYGASTIKEQSSMASKYSIDELTRIAETGNLPSGMKAGTPLSVLEDYAKANNDAALTLKLATSPLTTKISESASELSLSRMRSSTNPVDVIRTVMDDRMKVLEPKISKTVSEIKKSIKQPVPTKESWTKFIDDITC